jgi:hypothetical protein
VSQSWLKFRKADRHISEKAIKDCIDIGLKPLPNPLRDGHHCDIELTDHDKKVGSALAYFMGTMYSDVGPCGCNDCYFYSKITSVEEWARVARALRVHGLRIANQRRG